ncbi:MAG: TIGR01777 family protein [Methanobacteriota archaeon]|nr:MAG: TIGR01777 family protein [Euryarchaeota archaeon]
MRYIITGGSGFIGQLLIPNLPKDSEIFVLTRGESKEIGSVKYVTWDARTRSGWSDLITEDTIILNLAGHNISKGRWTKKTKDKIISSRVQAGKACVDAIAKSGVTPYCFFQASAVGYYGWHADEILDEESKGTGADFLSQVCMQWEESTSSLETMGVRRIVGRIGVVFHPKHGAFPLLVLPIKLFVGGPVGTGNQWISWIHYQDLIRSILFVINNKNTHGVFNLTSPCPVINKKLGHEIAKKLRRPFWFRTPSFVLKMVLGKKADIVLAGQRVFPQRLVDMGFEFEFPTIEKCLDDLLGRNKVND